MQNLASIDAFGHKVSINLNKNKEIKTAIGGILTIICITLTLVSTWLIGNDIIYRKNPFSFQDSIVNSQYANISMSKDNFPIGFQILSHSLGINDPTYFNIQITKTFRNSNDKNNLIITPLAYRECTLQDFPKGYSTEYISKEGSSILCIDNQDFNLWGYFSEVTAQWLSINVYLCDYENNPNYCHSYSEIMDYISNKQILFSFFFLDVNIVNQNFLDPIQYFFSIPFHYLTYDQKNVNFYIEQDTIETDNGFFFTNLIYDYFFRAVESIAETSIYSHSLKCIFKANFFSSNATVDHHRSYIKATEIIASVGGIIKLLQMLFLFITYPFTINLSYIQTINELFKYNNNFYRIKGIDRTQLRNLRFTEKSSTTLNQLKANQDLKNSEIKDVKINLENSTDFNNFFINNKNNINENNQIINLKNSDLKNAKMNLENSADINNFFNNNKNINSKDLTKKSNNLKLSFLDNLKIILKKFVYNKLILTSNAKDFEKYLNKISNYFDLFNIFRLQDDLDHLKELLLDETQYSLFLTLKPDMEIINRNNLNENDLIHKLIEKIQNNEHTNIDIKLLGMMSTI